MGEAISFEDVLTVITVLLLLRVVFMVPLVNLDKAKTIAARADRYWSQQAFVRPYPSRRFGHDQALPQRLRPGRENRLNQRDRGGLGQNRFHRGRHARQQLDRIAPRSQHRQFRGDERSGPRAFGQLPPGKAHLEPGRSGMVPRVGQRGLRRQGGKQRDGKGVPGVDEGAAGVLAWSLG